MQIQAYYGQALQSGRRDGKGGLSARTVHHHHRVLHEALEQAVKWQLMGRNPTDAVEPPRPERQEMQALDAAETAPLLTTAANTRLYVPILLAVSTGLRRGEILGLRWQDVDLQSGALCVRQSLEQTRAGIAVKAPKTHRSRRAVALPSLVVAALVRHKGQQAQQKLLLGPAYQDTGLVNANDDGTPISPGAFTKSFGLLAKKAGRPGLRFHDLRHSHATQLLIEGVHPKVVSERLGHSTIAITLDLYSHVLPGMQEDAALRVDRALRAALGE